MLWKKIEGQAAAVAFLRQSLKKGKMAHAYLFQGPEGVGKALAARVLAQALNCRQDRVDPCGACPPCREIERRLHPDVFWWFPQGKARIIKIEQVRDLGNLAHLNAQRGGWKVFILEDADGMQIPAANALLKTLEEPPEQTMLILLSSRPEKLLPTVRSRCQMVRFNSWPLELMEAFLTRRAKIGKNEAGMVHSVSGGSPGRALRMIDEGFLTPGKWCWRS